MIAEAMVVSGLPPCAFGVEPSAELGNEVFEVLQERAEREQQDATERSLRSKLNRNM